MKSKALFYFVTLIFMVIVAVALVPEARAAYPEKPIEIVVHSAPGGGSDLFARVVALILEKEGIVKQKMNVVNRTGGAAAVAVNYLASKKGDPYVIMNVTTSPISALLRGTTQIKFEDITLLAMLVEDVNLVFTRYDSPFKDMKSFIAEAKKFPDKFNVAVGTAGGTEHVSSYRVAKAAGIKYNITTFKGGGEAAVALLGGHVDISFGNINEQMGQIEAKKVRPLAVMTGKRIPYLPDVPTLKEIGIDVEFSQVRGFWAPQDFPSYAVKFWEDAFEKLSKTKGFRDQVNATQGVLDFRKHEEFRKYLIKYMADLDQDVKALELYKEKK
ncbi:MAG: tripartite tricarboxylate transporter substrate binding protein [Thermodesulfobacteriota bacterium]|nr:tripartite tricarboxylate transporter substrate binding protein [Thermodesulfobacteriota bacterium]